MTNGKIQLWAWSFLFILWLAGCTVEFKGMGDQPSSAPGATLVPCVTVTAAITSTTPVNAISPITGTLPLTSTPPLTATVTLTAPPAVPITATRAVTATTMPTATLKPTRPVSATLTPGLTPGVTMTVTKSMTATLQPTPTGTRTPAAPLPSPTATKAPGSAPQLPTPTLAATNTPVPTSTPTPTKPVTPTPTRPAAATATNMATPTAIGGTAAPTPTPPPADSVYIRSQRSFTRDGNLFVVGEVVNGTAGVIYKVRITATFFNNSDQVVATQEGLAYLIQTSPDQRNPFKLQVENAPSDITRYELSLRWDDVSVISYQDLTVLTQELRQNDGPLIVGELRNDFNENLGSVILAVALYDAGGNVVDVYQGIPRATQLAPNETSPYEMLITADQPFTTFVVQSQGKRAVFF